MFASLSPGMASNTYKNLRHFRGFSLGKVPRYYDPLNVYKCNFWIYILSGFWRVESSKRWKTSLYKCYQTCIVLVYGASFVFFLIDAFLVRNDIDKLSFNMSSSVLGFIKILQIILLSGVKTDVEGLENQLENHFHLRTVGESSEDKGIFRQKAEVTLKISLLFYGILLMAFPLRVLADTVLGARGYLIPMPFKENLEAYYEYVYAQQVVVCFHFMVTSLSYDLVGFSFIVRFIGHYEVLAKNFLKIKTLYPRRNFEKYVGGYVETREGCAARDVLIRKTNYSEKTALKNDRRSQRADSEQCREEKTFQLLKDNVNHHQKLLAEVRSYFELYSRPLLIQVCGMVVLMGIVAIQFLFHSTRINLLILQQFLYACTALFNILCLCSFGSELTSKSISATHALYDTPWYDMSRSNRKAVGLIMQILSQPPVLKGGKMINIDRITYVKFLQSCYNMVALVRNKI